jgi:hypothetical protein
LSGASQGDPPAPGASRRRLAEAGYNPVVTSDGVRWRDYELAAEVPADQWRPVLRPLLVPEGPLLPRHDAPAHRQEGPAQRRESPVQRRESPVQRRESPVQQEDGPALWHGGVAQWPDGAPSPNDDDPMPRHDELLPQWPGTVADWFDGPERPPRLGTCRQYGTPGGLAWPDPQVQQDLCQSVPDGARFPDPRGTWVRLINGEGPADDPFRATNSLDCALAVLSTWHGEPMVAAPRQPEYNRVGRPSLSGEAGGVVRAERWLGHRFEYVGQGRRAYATVTQRLETGGHGSACVLITRWPSGGNHAWNAVNTAGEVMWIDAQRGHTSVEPPPGPVTGVFCVVVDRRGRRL